MYRASIFALSKDPFIRTMLKTMIRTRKILIHTSEAIEFVDIKNIVYIRANDNYSQVYLSNKPPILSIISFGKLAYLLSEHGFFQCHKSFTINLSAIKRYHKCGDIEMIDDTLVPLARRRKEAFIDIVGDASIHLS